MEIKHCQFCNSIINYDETWQHDACEEFTLFVLDEMITKVKRKLEILLLKRKELLIINKF
jgi:predicted nucleic acid-binding Zn ribbon protein